MSINDEARHLVRNVRVEADIEGVVSEDDEEDTSDEANKAWEMGKHLGLSVEDENAVIVVIVGAFDADKSKPMKCKRKKHKGKKKKEEF